VYVKPEPADSSRVVLDTRTSPAFPSAIMRADRRLAPATPAAPEDGHQGVVSDNPVVMPGWDVKDVSGPDLEFGAVVHPAVHGTGQREPHMVELAAGGTGRGAHML
jgi:hypothetical protein